MFKPKTFEKTIRAYTNILHVVRLPKCKFIRFNSMSYCSQSGLPKQEKIEDMFFNPQIQSILKKITTLNYDKVFAVSKRPLKPHMYEFVTDKRLKELQGEAASKAALKLQMPPVMSVRKEINEVLSNDPELQGYLKHKLVFTDISPSVSPRDRIITVRETDGTLRKATWEERDRMNQIFYPMPGKSLEIPKLFESPYLDRLLEEGSYQFVLDSACAQFEPDNPMYHKVTSLTYEHIKSVKKFDDLRSTRHFGPMAFYYALEKNIDPLLIDMINRQMISDASDLIRLLYLMHKELTFSRNIDKNDDIVVIEDYLENNCSQKSDLKLAMQTFLEQNSNINYNVVGNET